MTIEVSTHDEVFDIPGSGFYSDEGTLTVTDEVRNVVAMFAKGEWLSAIKREPATQAAEREPAMAKPLTASHRDCVWVDGDGYEFTHLSGGTWIATKGNFSYTYNEPVGTNWSPFTEVLEK